MTHDPGGSRADRHGYRVMARKCDQCLMTPQRIVSPARAKEILRDTIRKDCRFVCHKGSIAGRDVACRGHHDATGGGHLARIMGRIGAIIEVDPDTMQDIPHA